jgi:integrase
LKKRQRAPALRKTGFVPISDVARGSTYGTLLAAIPSAARLGDPRDVENLVKRLSGVLAPSTSGVVHRILAAVFEAAVRDRRIVASPCEGTKLPRNPTERIEPLTVDAVQALTEAMPGRYRALITLAAGTGLRQSEAFGLGLDRVDFLRRQLTVDRQLITLPGRPRHLPHRRPRHPSGPSRSPRSS